MRKKSERKEIRKVGFNSDNEEYNKFLYDMNKLKSIKPIIVDGTLCSTLGNKKKTKKAVLPKPDYGYMLSPWYGKARKEFLKETLDKTKYTHYNDTGLLQWHLIEINERAYDMEEKLIAEISAKEGVNVELKMRDQLGWVRKYNNIRARVREIIRYELIYIKTSCLSIYDIDMEYLKKKEVI